ncbi:MAG TPA: ComF family protein [Chromatiales bacterium]|nr:ComF family protein [Chromatiales bacterium]
MVYHWLNRARWHCTTDCILCGAATRLASGLCGACLADLPVNFPACPRCALPLATHGNRECGQCQQRPPWYHSAFVPFRYSPPLPAFITGLKFNARLAHARLLGILLRDAVLASGPPRPDCLLPVPLHPRRLRQRGFNQALEIARPVANAIAVPILSQGIRRQRDTRPQSDLDARRRHSNLRNAFRIDTWPGYRHVAIVDDVITTGTTVNELARVLKEAGVTTVQIWALARA